MARKAVLAFTDIEGSTPLWERAPEAMEAGLTLHNAALRGLIAEHGGYEVKTEGDAFMVAFESAGDAVRWCLACQEALFDLEWPAALLEEPESGPSADGCSRGLRVRMGVHLGEARAAADPTTGRMDFFGPVVNRAARVSGAAHGGQVIVSGAVLEEASLGDDEAVLQDLGEHRLKGMEQVERLWQVLPPRLSCRSFPPPRTLNPHRTNLPAHPTSFKGRMAELQAVGHLFDEGARLVTLLGPGGVGKTRLSCRFAAQQLHRYQQGGAWFVDLSEARDLTGVLRAVSMALSVPLTAGATEEDSIVQLGNAIAGRGPILLVLDNFEQLVEVAPRTVGRWLARAAEASFLVTSRERLLLDGEAVREVEPLSTEDAAALFMDRALAARPGIETGEADRAAIEAIVEQLDGLPLAIELAAARAKIMSPVAIKERLGERFRLLSGRGRGVPSRQATLEGAIDWSWDLLSDWEREALAQCSVFRGGWSLEAAEAVVDISAWEDAPWAVDVIQALVDKSLVRALPLPGDGGELRFGFYESIREYAARKLTEPAAAEARHGEFYARLDEEEAIGALVGPGGVEALRELEAELENLVEATRRAIVRGEPAVAARAALAASEVFELRGPFGFGMSLLSDALGAAPDEELAVRLGLRRGRLAWLAGKMDDALVWLENALVLARNLEDRKHEGSVLHNLGALHRIQGRMEEARGCYQAALAIHREVGDRRGEGIVLGNLGDLHRVQGEMNEARACCEAALAIHREAGDRRGEGIVLVSMGILHRTQGRMEEAGACYQAALANYREVGDHRGEGMVLGNLGVLHRIQGRVEEASADYEAALAIHREVGDRRFEGIVLGNLGFLHKEQGRMEEARTHFEAALDIHREVGNRRFEGVVLGNLGLLHNEEGRMEEARAHFEAAIPILREVGDRGSEGWVLGELGTQHKLRGRMEEARAHYEAALAIHREVGDRRFEGRMLGELGALHHEEGRISEAGEALAAGEALLRAVNDPMVLATLLCGRARLAGTGGDSDEARSILAEARALAEKAGAGPSTHLGRLLTRAQEEMDGA